MLESFQEQMRLFDYPELGMQVTTDSMPGVRFSGGGAGVDDRASFRCTQTSANKVMVYAGTIRHHGLGHWNTVDTEITLGDSEYRWIFVNFYRDTLWNPTIEQQVEEPISDTSTIRIPLSYWRQTSPGSFTLVKTTHKYDVQMGNPLV